MSKEKFAEISKKHSLPSYKDLDKYFQISDLEEESHLLKAIRKKIKDTLTHYSDILENIISPDGSFTNIIESKAFSDEDKLKVADLFKKIQLLFHDSELASLEYSDEKDAEFISKSFSLYPDFVVQLKEIIKKQKSSWKDKIISGEEIHYFG